MLARAAGGVTSSAKAPAGLPSLRSVHPVRLIPILLLHPRICRRRHCRQPGSRVTTLCCTAHSSRTAPSSADCGHVDSTGASQGCCKGRPQGSAPPAGGGRAAQHKGRARCHRAGEIGVPAWVQTPAWEPRDCAPPNVSPATQLLAVPACLPSSWQCKPSTAQTPIPRIRRALVPLLKSPDCAALCGRGRPRRRHRRTAQG